MSLTYSTYVTSLANLLVVPEADDGFQTDLPNIIEDAELRAYRDLDLLNTTARATTTLTSGNRNLAIPSSAGTMVVTEQINVISPATATTADGGTRNPLTPTSREVLDALWPSSTGSTVPTYFAMVTQTSAIIGPWPDAAYLVEVVGTIRPQTLSSSNVTTLLSVYFPDLLIAASMVRASAYQQNYGQAVDDPRQAMTWEQHYQQLLADAQTEEARKKFASVGWSSREPSRLATPPAT